MDGYQLLANAIVEQAADDYFNVLAGFPTPPDITREKLEKFFHSEWYDLLTNLNADYLIQKIKEEAAKMILEYTVAKEKGSSRYYVIKVGETERLSNFYTTKKKALHKAAELQGIEYKTYMKIRRRDGISDDKN